MVRKASVSLVKEDVQLIPTLTIKQVARLLNMHSNTVIRWIMRGIIRPYYITTGGSQRFRLEDIARFLSEPDINLKKQRRLIGCTQM